jgi:hypothetical protein
MQDAERTSFCQLKKPSHVSAIGVKFDFSIDDDDDAYYIPGAESEPTQHQLVR